MTTRVVVRGPPFHVEILKLAQDVLRSMYCAKQFVVLKTTQWRKKHYFDLSGLQTGQVLASNWAASSTAGKGRLPDALPAGEGGIH